MLSYKPELKLVVQGKFKEASLNCFEVIKGSSAELEALSTQKEGLAKLSRTLELASES